MLKSKLQKILEDDQDIDNIIEILTTGLKDNHHLWNVYEEGLEIDKVILKALMKGKTSDLINIHIHV